MTIDPASASRREGPPSCVLTFDVEDWFQTENLRAVFPRASWERLPRRVAAATRGVLDLLADRGVRATFFVLGWVAEREPSLIRAITDAGHEVACHGYGHVRPSQLTSDEFRDDVLRARAVLEDLAGQPVSGYRAPSFDIDRDQLQILADLGFRYDTSVHPFTLHDRYAKGVEIGPPLRPGVHLLGGRLVELTLPVERWAGLPVPIGGGGYFRLLPPGTFSRFVRRALRRDGHYLMYLHTWEFDATQPKAQGAGVTNTFRHYNHLGSTRRRFTQLITMLQAEGAQFMTAGELVDGLTASDPLAPLELCTER